MAVPKTPPTRAPDIVYEFTRNGIRHMLVRQQIHKLKTKWDRVRASLFEKSRKEALAERPSDWTDEEKDLHPVLARKLASDERDAREIRSWLEKTLGLVPSYEIDGVLKQWPDTNDFDLEKKLGDLHNALVSYAPFGPARPSGGPTPSSPWDRLEKDQRIARLKAITKAARAFADVLRDKDIPEDFSLLDFVDDEYAELLLRASFRSANRSPDVIIGAKAFDEPGLDEDDYIEAIQIKTDHFNESLESAKAPGRMRIAWELFDYDGLTNNQLLGFDKTLAAAIDAYADAVERVSIKKRDSKPNQNGNLRTLALTLRDHFMENFGDYKVSVIRRCLTLYCRGTAYAAEDEDLSEGVLGKWLNE